MLVGLVALVAVIRPNAMGSGLAGLVIVYTLSFTENITFLARCHSDCQMSMNSVERVMEYVCIETEKYDPDNLGTGSEKQEGVTAHRHSSPRPSLPLVRPPHARIAPTSTDSSWPSCGAIQFVDLFLKYQPSGKPVLK